MSGWRFAMTCVCAGAITTGCNWGRFTKLKEDTPVVRLEPSDSYEGLFGRNLAVAEGDGRAELYVAGGADDTGGLVYSLGMSEDPQPNPTDEEHCQGDDDCSTVDKPVGLNVAHSSSEPHELCFVSGFGTVGDNSGLWTRCDDNNEFVIPVPADVEGGLSASGDRERAPALQLATNRGDAQMLAVSTAAQARAWVYLPGSRDPIDLPTPPEAGDDFGARISVAQFDGGHLVAVSAPDSAELWIFRVDVNQTTRLGCLSGAPKFGRSVESGEVDDEGAQDFVVADAAGVSVFSGEVLASLGAATDGTCAAQEITGDALLAEIACDETDVSTGCAGSDFGDSLAVADVDGDGVGEVFVGAPGMKVRDVAKAGAVLAYDQFGALLNAQIVSDGKEGDLFGTSLAPISQGEREILAVGAGGRRSVYLLYCAGGSDGGGSARCK